MNNYKIFTDSACDITPEVLTEWGVSCVSLAFRFDHIDQDFLNEDMPIKEFYQNMRDGHIAKTDAFQKNSFRRKQDFMHRHRRILGTYGLPLIAQKFDAAIGKNERRLFGDGDIPCDQNPLRTGSFRQNGSGSLRRHITLMPCHEAVPHEGIQRQALHSFALRQEMKRRIDVGTVVGAHGKGGEIIHIPFYCTAEHLLLRDRVA